MLDDLLDMIAELSEKQMLVNIEELIALMESLATTDQYKKAKDVYDNILLVINADRNPNLDIKYTEAFNTIRGGAEVVENYIAMTESDRLMVRDALAIFKDYYYSILLLELGSKKTVSLGLATNDVKEILVKLDAMDSPVANLQRLNKGIDKNLKIFLTLLGYLQKDILELTSLDEVNTLNSIYKIDRDDVEVSKELIDKVEYTLRRLRNNINYSIRDASEFFGVDIRGVYDKYKEGDSTVYASDCEAIDLHITINGVFPLDGLVEIERVYKSLQNRLELLDMNSFTRTFTLEIMNNTSRIYLVELKLLMDIGLILLNNLGLKISNSLLELNEFIKDSNNLSTSPDMEQFSLSGITVYELGEDTSNKSYETEKELVIGKIKDGTMKNLTEQQLETIKKDITDDVYKEYADYAIDFFKSKKLKTTFGAKEGGKGVYIIGEVPVPIGDSTSNMGNNLFITAAFWYEDKKLLIKAIELALAKVKKHASIKFIVEDSHEEYSYYYLVDSSGNPYNIYFDVSSNSDTVMLKSSTTWDLVKHIKDNC